MKGKKVFEEIKPLCIDVLKNRNLEAVNNLEQYLDKLLIEESKETGEPISVLDDFKEFIALPLALLLKEEKLNSGKKNTLLEAILKTLKKVLEKAYLIEWNFFKDVFALLIHSITSPENPQRIANVSEESKEYALECSSLLWKSISSEHWKKLCSDDFRAQLGHSVYICLQISEKEKNRNLRILAFNLLEHMGLKPFQNQLDETLINNLSAAYANVLPGIAMSTTRIATGGDIQSHKLSVAALECWQYYVVLVMRDKFLSTLVKNFGVSDVLLSLRKKLNLDEKLDQAPEGQGTQRSTKSKFHIPDENDESETCSPKLKNVIIDQKWVESTSDKLLILFKSVLSLVSHSHWRVRKALVELCQSIYTHCPRSMETCLILCLEALITLKSDEVMEVNQAADRSLILFRNNFGDDEDAPKLMELLEERVFALSTRLPTLIRTQDDTKLLSSLHQLRGTLEVMGPRVKDLVQMPSHLQRLLHALIVLLTYDYSDSDLLYEKFMTDDSLEVMAIKPHLGLTFRYFHSESILRCAFDSCNLIGRLGDLPILTDQCLDLVQESSVSRNEVLLTLNLILQGSINQLSGRLHHSEREKLVEFILDALMGFKFLEVSISANLETTGNEDTVSSSLVTYHKFKSSVSLDLAKRNVILISNSLKVIGTCALLLKEEFKGFLFRVMCIVMEKAGESNALVAHSALCTLQDIATSCGYSSVPELVEKTVHLFWFDLSQKLKRLPDFPSSPQVLRVALKCHNGEVKSFIEELVEDVLDSLDAFHSESPLPLLTVLLSFVDTLSASVDKTNSKKSTNENVSTSKENTDESLSIVEFIIKLHAENEKINEIMEDRSDSEEEMTPEEGFKKYHEEMNAEEEMKAFQNEEEEEELPKHIDLAVRIMERCSYLLFVKDRKCQLVILQIVQCCCTVLHDWENQKLPCFHKIWKPLITRLKDKDFIVVLKALEVCVVMVDSSADFLRKRFLEEFFPFLLSFLSSQSSVSLHKTPKSGYFHTPAFKMQSHVLKHIPKFIRSLNFGVTEETDLLQALLPYLDDNQPLSLSELAFEGLSALKEQNSDLVWLGIALSKGPFRIAPPSPLLKPVFINGSSSIKLNKKALQLFEELS